MPSTNKTQTPPPTRKQDLKQKKPADLQRAIRETATDAVKSAVFDKRPYLKAAFANPYNVSLLMGTLAAAVATANPILAAVALGAEALWLLHGPESSTLRKLLWDPRFDKIRLALETKEREERIKDLAPEVRARVGELAGKQEEINRLAAQNPSFTGELLRSELVKTRRLVDSYIEMAVTCGRYENYLETVDREEIERDRERWLDRSRDERSSTQERDIAAKNFAVIMKRIEKIREISDYLRVARAQLDLIENSFQLIADQIVMMQSPAELSGQLDDLLDGVESIRQTSLDTEKMITTFGI
ncbi:MAG TPA: hypothetical protein VNM92_13910 [Thermoanaerobaculia bacterium]|nr:hypothetical protein [Thermoanaerobaculia bacterium]